MIVSACASKWLVRQMTMERVRPFQFVRVYLCTSHYHVFYAHKQYHRHLTPIQNHYLVDMIRCIWIWKITKKMKLNAEFQLCNSKANKVQTHFSLCAYDFRLFTLAASDEPFVSWAAMVAASKLCDFLWYGDALLSAGFIWPAAPKLWFVILELIK